MSYRIFVYELCVHLRMTEHVWSWSHDTHISFEYVPQLWQFVDACLPQEIAEWELACVIFRRLTAVSLFVYVHRTEFVDHERLSV